MPVKQTIHVHCLSLNDAELLPFFFRHCQGWADHVHVWALDSQDETGEWVAARTDATLHACQVEGDSLVNTQRALFDSVWQRSRGQADWVVLLNADEHLHHPDPRAYLAQRTRDGVTAVRAIGYEMVADRTPATLDASRPLSTQITQGCRSPGLDRLVAFSPAALTATHFAPGQHHAWPEGHVVWPASPELLLLRYQALDEDWNLDRTRQRALRVLPGDRAHGWAAHLGWSDDERRAHLATLRQRARTVPGLGELAHLPPTEYRGDERTVEASGLLEADWYELNNPDIAGHQFDALTHFCEYGWREGRAPNPYFDLAAYAQEQGLPAGLNPLIDYIRRGEREGARPSPRFDPAWYRTTHQLGPADSPLAHYLAHRHETRLSPLPGFDPRAHPDADRDGADPLHSLAAGQPQPRWEQVLQMLREDQPDQAPPPLIPMSLLQHAVKPLIAGLPFDADWYLQAYPDVAQAVAEGAFRSAQDHFIEHGFFEGRLALPESDAPDGKTQ